MRMLSCGGMVMDERMAALHGPLYSHPHGMWGGWMGRVQRVNMQGGHPLRSTPF
jgi:hypothetical protein